jgi:hypothetical protein
VFTIPHLNVSWARSTPSHHTCLRYFLILSLYIHLGLLSGPFAPGFPTKIFYDFLAPPMRPICPAHHILLNLINLIICGKEYKLWSSLRNFLQHPPATSPVTDPNIILGTMFSKACSLWETKFHTRINHQIKLYWSNIFSQISDRKIKHFRGLTEWEHVPPSAVTSVCRVHRLLEAPQLVCKQWGTARSIDATLQTSRLASYVLEISGIFQHSFVFISKNSKLPLCNVSNKRSVET